MCKPVGLLTLQGDYEKHRQAFASLGRETFGVRRPEELADVSCLVIPLLPDDSPLRTHPRPPGRNRPAATSIRVAEALRGGTVLLSMSVRGRWDGANAT